jgi:AsmA protein
MSKPLKYGLIGAGVVLLLVLLAPFLIPANAYRTRIEQAAFERTGRELKIHGALHVTLIPTLGVRADDVTLANVPGGVAPHMATMDDVEVGVRLWPLLGGRIEVSEIVLDKPVIALERDKSGHGNWIFRDSTPKHAKGEGFSTRFSGIRINGGKVSYRNADGKVRGFDRVDMTIGLTAVDKPVTLDGEISYRGKHVALEAWIANLAPLAPGKSRLVDVSLTSDLLQASFKGDVSFNGDLAGAVKLDTTNMRGVAEWLGENLPQDSGFKTLSLEGRIETTGSVIALPEESLRLDAMTITGHMSADLSGKRPRIGGDVVVDRLDLNRYLEAPTKPRQTSRKPANDNANAGWSTDPIDLSVLHLFDANLTIDTGVLRIRGLHINKTRLLTTLTDGLLNVNLDPMQLYGGTGKASLIVDVRGPIPQFQNTLAFDNVSIRALLTDSMNAQRITGRAKLALSVTSQGNSADVIMRSLAGRGSVLIANGQILGVDLGGVARLIRTALTGTEVNPNAATPFNAMGANFVIAKGVLATKDFHLDGKEFKATGTGTVDLGNRTVDFFVKPRAVLLPVGGFTVGFPFRAHGPWRNIVYTADVVGTVTGLVSDVFQNALAVPGALGNFLTGGQAQQKPQTSQKKTAPKKKPGFFDKLFGH